MKNIVRAFALVLTLTGAASSTYPLKAVVQVVKPKPSSLPIPMCPPDDPNACGIDK